MQISIMGREFRVACEPAEQKSLQEAVEYLNRKMQDEMIMEIEQNKPKIIVYSLVSASWMRKPDSPAEIFDWTSTYLSQNYQLVGVVDIGSNLTNFAWDDDAKTYQHKSSQYMMIYKRNG